MIVYPSNILPLPLIGISGRKRSSVISTEMESGDLRQRRRFSTNKKEINVEFIFNYRQFGLFESFVENKLDAGATKFALQFPDASTQTNEHHTAQIVGGEYEFEQIAAQLKWRVSCLILLDFSRTISEDELDLAIEYSDNLELAQNEIETLGEEMGHFGTGNDHDWERD